jgi:hypothetical protein
MPPTAIGVVVSDDKITLPQAPDGYVFVPIVRAPGKDAAAELEARSPQATSRVLIDLTGLTVDKLMDWAYRLSLNPQNISRLDRLTINEIFNIATAGLPPAESLNLDMILTGLSKQPGNRFSGKSLPDIKDMLVREEARAATDYWHDRPEGFTGAMAAEISANTKDGKISVVAFDRAALAGEAALKAVQALNERMVQEKKKVRYVVIDRAKPGTIIEQVAESAGAKQEDIGRVSVAIVRPSDDPMADVRDYINSRGEKVVSCVVSAEPAENIININTASLLHAAKTNKPSFVALGYGDGAFSAIEDLIRTIGGFFRIVPVSQAIQAIFTAIKLTSISA